MDKKYLLLIIPIALMMMPTILYLTNAQISEPIETRKEYVYCPIDFDTLPEGDYEINGCPTIRVYVENYDRLDDTTRTEIDNSLRTSGFTPREESRVNEDDGTILRTDTQ